MIIGSGSLPIRCAEIILEKGHSVRAMISSDPVIAEWARKTGISYFDSVEACGAGLTESVDHLFSINNEHILTQDVLRLATNYAINYHDSLLPKYAGTHATSWALLNGEVEHGITWHVIANKVDAGDILQQRIVEIAADETALSLNTKCFEAAIAAFAELVDEVAGETVEPIQQNPDNRSFYPRYKRPSLGGLITWERSAEDISRSIRAFDFGRHPNPLGTAKLLIGDEFFVVREVEIPDSVSSAGPGTVVHIGHEALQIATADKDIRITSISTVDGKPLSISELSQRFDLREGQRLADIGDDRAKRIDELVTGTAKSENYWVEKLSRSTPVSAPYSSAIRSAKSAEYSTSPIVLPKEFLKFIDGQSGSRSLHVNLLAAFGALLYRLTASETFSIGYTNTNLQWKIDDLHGLFATTLPLKLVVDHQQPLLTLVGSLLREIDQIDLGTTYLRDVRTRYPKLLSDNDLDRKPFWPVCFAEIDKIEAFIPKAESDLTLAVSATDCFWVFNRDRLEEGDVQKISVYLQTLLKSFAASSATPVGTLAIMSVEEQRRLLSYGQGRSVEYSSEKCIHQLFEQGARKTPDAIALLFEDQELTYRELNGRANQLANHLMGLGVTPGQPIGIAADRSVELIVGVIGVAKAGGYYVPLDTDMPSERLSHIVSDAGLSVVLSLKRFAEKMQSRFGRVICLDSDWESIAQSEDANPRVEIPSTNPVYAIYTSGSTGRPKGVLISHRSLVNHATAISNHYELGSSDRVLQFANFSFDVAAEEIFPSLISGAAVVILPVEVQSSLVRFSKFLNEQAISVVNLPVSYWREWTSSLNSADTSISAGVRLVVTGSERVFPEDYNAWRKIAGPNVRWLNAYGLTETTITSLIFEPSDRRQVLNTIPIGKPIDNTQAYVLDKNREPVPIGISGELYIGGDGLALGYLNRTEDTASRFVSDPFRSADDRVLFRTGDLVRTLPNGNFDYLDRIDNQVKIRGFRVELGEIESALSLHPSIEKAVVIARESDGGAKELMAYYVVRGSKAPSVNTSIEIWPSLGEYPIYDELMYYAMSTDRGRTSRYETAINQLVKDKVVVDIGTGQDLVLARMCIAAGAAKVYAIEGMEESYEGAKAFIENHGLSNRIILLKGFSTEIELPEKADVCVSEIIGTIGSSEGVVPILNDARRFLKAGGRMIPERCITRIAAVQIPNDVLESPRFSMMSELYAKKIFDSVGYEFDVRVCLKDLPEENQLSESEAFEDLDFTRNIDPNTDREILLTVNKGGRLDGFLLWLNLFTISGQMIDNSVEESSWLPVFFPAFDQGIDVSSGDVIRAVCRSQISDNWVNPDYRIEGTLHRKNCEPMSFSHESFHHAQEHKKTPFYRRLLGKKLVTDGVSPEIGTSDVEIRDFLSAYLPLHMIPACYVQLDQLPLTPNGKVDRQALPIPEATRLGASEEYEAPTNETEAKLSEIWGEVLGIEKIGISDNFFDLGGHSLLAIRMFAQVEATFKKSIPLATLFEAGTICKLAEIIDKDDWAEPESSMVAIQPKGTRPVLFCVHAGGGNVLFYRDLAKHLGTEQPLYGIQARRIGGRQVAHETIEEMATFYISELQAIQPLGPYYLSGSSFGGLVALEMARQLNDLGENIALLALLDTGSPFYPEVLRETTPFRALIYGNARRVQHHVESLRALKKSGRSKYVAAKLEKIRLRYRRKVRGIYLSLVKRFFSMYKPDGSLPAQYIQVEDQIIKAHEKYVPKPYAGKMTLFRAANQPLGIVPDPSLGWDGIPADLEIHEVPGHHGSVVSEPYVGVLAEKLAGCIDRTLRVNEIEYVTKSGNGDGAVEALPDQSRSASKAGIGRSLVSVIGLVYTFELICVELLDFLAGF